MKISDFFLSEKLPFLVVKFSVYLNGHVFVMRVFSVLLLLLLLLCFIEIPVFNANNVDPDQTPRSVAASDLGLHCLPITLLGVPGKAICEYQNVQFNLRNHVNS